MATNPSTKPRKPQIQLTLESVPSTVPVAIRLRSVLKRLLRTYGFRCTRIDGDALDGPAAPPTSQGEPKP